MWHKGFSGKTLPLRTLGFTFSKTAFMNDIMKKAILKVVVAPMDKVMDKVLISDPFIIEKLRAEKPLYTALVPEEIFKASYFERKFITLFDDVWEKLAFDVATAYHGHCARGVTLEGSVGRESLRRIYEVLNRPGKASTGEENDKPNLKKELEYIKAGGGESLPVSVTCDLLIKSGKTGKTYSFNLSEPLPSYSQAKSCKENILKLHAMNEHIVDEAYYAIVYNPYRKKEYYVWDNPKQWFDMTDVSSVLIGQEFWDFIGGEGAYETLVSEINKIGASYRKSIYREYIRKEPPVGFDKWKL